VRTAPHRQSVHHTTTTTSTIPDRWAITWRPTGASTSARPLPEHARTHRQSVAGVGGPAGLAGSDGAAVQRTAAERGAVSRAARTGARRARRRRGGPARCVDLTAAGSMGEDVVRQAGLEPVVGPHVGRADERRRHVGGGSRPRGRGSVPRALRGRRRHGTRRRRRHDDGRRGARDPRGREDVLTGVRREPPGRRAVSPPPGWRPRAGAACPCSSARCSTSTRRSSIASASSRGSSGTLAVPHRPGRTQARKSATPAGERRPSAGRPRSGIRHAAGRPLPPGARRHDDELARVLGVPKSPLGVDVVLDGRLVRAAPRRRSSSTRSAVARPRPSSR
jgi:hypothetical protein